MNSKTVYIIGSLIVVVALFVVFGGAPDIRNYPPKDGPIVAFGDSLVAGVGASKGKDFVSLLSQRVGEPIRNLGVSGDTTAMGLARIDDAISLEPRIAIILLGGNDFLRKVPRPEVFANLRAIIDRLQARGTIVLLLGVRGGLFTDSADGLYEDLTKETGSAYVENILLGLFGDQKYMSDSIHPNDTGYARIAERVYPVLANLIK